MLFSVLGPSPHRLLLCTPVPFTEEEAENVKVGSLLRLLELGGWECVCRQSRQNFLLAGPHLTPLLLLVLGGEALASRQPDHVKAEHWTQEEPETEPT